MYVVWLKRLGLLAAVGLLITLSALGARTAVTELSGLAVAQSPSTWKNVRDASAGDNLVDGILSSALMFFDSVGNNFDRLRGSITNGILVDVTRAPGSNQTPADGFANPTTFQGVWALNGVFNNTTWDRWRGGTYPGQGPTTFNAEVVSVANTIGNVVLAAVAGQRNHVYKISRGQCSPNGTAAIQVLDGATIIYSTYGDSVPSPPLSFEETWGPAGLTGTAGNTMTLQVGACGGTSVGRFFYEADRY